MAADNARLGFTLDSGSIFVEGPIDPQLAARCSERFAANPAVGAQVIFVGQVRADEIEAGTVTGIEYSAHESMALKAFGALVRRTAARVPLLDLELRHSLGYVPVGGASLLIAVATAHRQQAYAASRALLEAIKQEVPIYGRELTNQDRSSWKINR
ncbi:MAG: molybdenum cofactor biosynthesis protein MoaE [Spirochaetaceae bacterium]|nr:MAG: molybdenum cofactor biosynthesis protein MoaE [Spirochaetaceae bacterium]